MTMAFRTVKSAITTLLGNEADGNFRVIGYQGQSRDASEILGDNRTVQVFFSRGEYKSDMNALLAGPFDQDVTFSIDLAVSEASKVDLSLMTSSTATAEQIALAMSAYQNASELADEAWDELCELVWQILMDARNYDLGFSKGEVRNRWVETVSKDDPLPRGMYVVLTGKMDFSCRVTEEVFGEEPSEVVDHFDAVIDIEYDDVEKTGVSGFLGPYDDDTVLTYGDDVIMYDGTPFIYDAP